MNKQQLIEKIDQYCLLHGYSHAVFGVMCMNDSRFVYELKKKRSPTMATVEKVLKFMKVKQ